MGTRIAGVLRRRLRWRGRRAAGFLGLLALSAALLAWGRGVTGYNQQLLLNIGASIVIVAFSYAIVDPLFEELRRSRVEEHPRFDDEEFSAHVATATSMVSIMDSGSHLLEGAGGTVSCARCGRRWATGCSCGCCCWIRTRRRRRSGRRRSDR